MALTIAHDYGHGHQIHSRCELRGRLFGLHFGGGLALRGGLLRHGERDREEERRQAAEPHGFAFFILIPGEPFNLIDRNRFLTVAAR